VELGEQPNDEFIDKDISPHQKVQGTGKMGCQKTSLQESTGVVTRYEDRTVKRDAFQVMQINLTEKNSECKPYKWSDEKIQHELLRQCGQKYYFHCNSEVSFEAETFNYHWRGYGCGEITGCGGFGATFQM